MTRYKRVLLKLSGAAISGEKGFGFDPEMLEYISNEIVSLRELGTEVCIVIGGGNIFRGNMADTWSINRPEADNIGTMATVINSLFLRGVLTAKDMGEVRVMTSHPMNAVAEPFVRLRAMNHLEKGYIVIFAGGTGQPYITTDYASVQRALEVECDAILVAKNGTEGVYDKDPRKHLDAKLFSSISYDTVIEKKLEVMDQVAFILARDNKLPIHVFDFNRKNAMKEIISGKDIGTIIEN